MAAHSQPCSIPAAVPFQQLSRSRNCLVPATVSFQELLRFRKSKEGLPAAAEGKFIDYISCSSQNKKRRAFNLWYLFADGNNVQLSYSDVRLQLADDDIFEPL